MVFGTSFGNGVFVAVCGAYSTGTAANVSQALTSSDGVEWARWEIGPGWLYDVAFGNGVFVAAGGYRLFRSVDLECEFDRVR